MQFCYLYVGLCLFIIYKYPGSHSQIFINVVSAYSNGLYGLSILVIFLLSLVIAFVYEINLGALNLERRYTPIVKPLINKLYL